MEVKFHALLTSALDGYEWSASHSSHFVPREETPLPFRQGSGWARDGLNIMAKRKALTLAIIKSQK
jgi:hypothetical protein